MTPYPSSVAIIYHEFDERKNRQRYLVGKLAERWEARGIRVHYLFGTRTFVPADVAILNVNLSVVPAAYLRFARRYPVALNGRVSDIRKRTTSTLRVESPRDYNGPVLVKTDLNDAGKPERKIRAKMLKNWRRNRVGWKGVLRGMKGWVRGETLPPELHSEIDDADVYRIYPSAREVPAECFDDPELIVERFLPEKHGDHYHHRRYYFFGSAEVCQLWIGSKPIAAHDIDGEEVIPIAVPGELRRLRKRYQMDMGKIDYVEDESGKPIVFDLNKTPSGDAPYPGEEAWLDALVSGLETGLEFFARPREAVTLQPSPASVR